MPVLTAVACEPPVCLWCRKPIAKDDYGWWVVIATGSMYCVIAAGMHTPPPHP
ncbi:hypothetical protein [Planomonospora sp. ID82291]|uniref:hypothetical protein n=1 Tax=Planomonospora sp. ID82291 TaxID=2738136 RepID=UPI0018C3C6E4|nr:hypothetical protein [Planomonospora sp. ID82291]MBG0818288.1 hypothetical protein [Planomonospora sp. ID82291]